MAGISIALKIVIICAAAVGLYTGSGPDHKRLPISGFVYFTVLSVAFSLLYFTAYLILAIFGADGGRPMYFVHGAVILCVTVTMTVYHFILIPNLKNNIKSFRIFTVPNICMHYAVPLLTIIDWALFAPKGRFTYYDPLLWTILFLLYFVAVIIRAKRGGIIEGLGSKYPYYFIDIDAIGVKKTLRNAAFLTPVVVALGYILALVDRLTAGRA